MGYYINKNGNYYEGDRQDNDVVVPLRPSSMHIWNDGTEVWDYDLAPAQDKAKIDIDAKAGEVREKYITVVSGQEATYVEKAKDAQRYIDDGVPEITDGSVYPFTWAESVAMSNTPLESSNYIIATRDLWLQIAANIEQERRNGKITVDVAINETEVATAFNSAIAALDVL